MIYPCNTVPIGSMADSRAKTLCDNCKSRDCENPIESRLVSIVGVNKRMRVYVTRTSTSIVTQCDGYNP